MKRLMNLTLCIVILYVIFRLLGSYVLPLWRERREKRYRKQLLDRNPQIDGGRLEQRLKEDRDSIIDKRKLFK